MSSISQIGLHILQNPTDLNDYQNLINAGKLPAVMIMGDVVSLYHQLNAPTLTYAAL